MCSGSSLDCAISQVWSRDGPTEKQAQLHGEEELSSFPSQSCSWVEGEANPARVEFLGQACGLGPSFHFPHFLEVEPI